jgi:hypothetical protein
VLLSTVIVESSAEEKCLVLFQGWFLGWIHGEEGLKVSIYLGKLSTWESSRLLLTVLMSIIIL